MNARRESAVRSAPVSRPSSVLLIVIIQVSGVVIAPAQGRARFTPRQGRDRLRLVAGSVPTRLSAGYQSQLIEITVFTPATSGPVQPAVTPPPVRLLSSPRSGCDGSLHRSCIAALQLEGWFLGFWAGFWKPETRNEFPGLPSPS
jgi:hypothetical protein